MFKCLKQKSILLLKRYKNINLNIFIIYFLYLKVNHILQVAIAGRQFMSLRFSDRKDRFINDTKRMGLHITNF